jgi:lysophospholipase L1-like esterase
VNVTAGSGPRGCRLGVLAFGDSITNGGGELQWGVALQSWALWVARALGLPFTSYAFDGARAGDVIRAQIPAFERDDRGRDARYELGCLYIGVNDVRALDWDVEAFAAGFGHALAFAAARCDATVALTAPLDLGRPRVRPGRLQELNGTIERAAGTVGAHLVDLSDFGARNHVMVDHVHPTAFGQIAIAERVLRTLSRDDSLHPYVWPSTLIAYETTRWRRLRGDATYVYRRAKVAARAAAITRLAAVRRPPSPHEGDEQARA